MDGRGGVVEGVGGLDLGVVGGLGHGWVGKGFG